LRTGQLKQFFTANISITNLEYKFAYYYGCAKTDVSSSENKFFITEVP